MFECQSSIFLSDTHKREYHTRVVSRLLRLLFHLCLFPGFQAVETEYITQSSWKKKKLHTRYINTYLCNFFDTLTSASIGYTRPIECFRELRSIIMPFLIGVDFSLRVRQ